MKFAPKHIVAAGLLAGLGLVATAQTPPAPPAGSAPPAMQRGPGSMDRMHDRMQSRMHEHRQERMAHRMARLKETLRITPAQEGAWTAFTTAMRPTPKQRPDIGEMARLTTPERIDRMRQLRGQRMAEQDRRGEATKAFYGQLSAEQKRVFDQLTLRMHGKGRHAEGRGRHHDGMRG